MNILLYVVSGVVGIAIGVALAEILDIRLTHIAHEYPGDEWLTPEERMGVQTRADAEIALKVIAERKAAAQEN